MTEPRSSKTNRPAKRAQMTDAQREEYLEKRREEKAAKKEKERRDAIDAAKRKDEEIRKAFAERGEEYEDFGEEGVFDEHGHKQLVPYHPPLPVMPAFENVPVPGEKLLPSQTAAVDDKMLLSAGQREVFLQHYATYGTVGSAAWAAGTNITTIQRLKAADPRFAAQFAEAYERVKCSIDEAVIKRGRDGWLEPVFSASLGVRIGSKRVFDPRLLELAAKKLSPEKYGDQVKVDHTVKGVLVVERGKPTKEEWYRTYAEQIAGGAPAPEGPSES
jgi:hypothetical protein